MTTIIMEPRPWSIKPAELAFQAAVAGGMGAITAAVFTTLSPLGGAIFGASFYTGFVLSGYLIHWISEKTNCPPDSIIFRVAKSASVILGIISSIVAATLITTAIGFPMTLMTGITLVGVPVAIAFSGMLVILVHKQITLGNRWC
jgi:hypothetical protein